jgi:demethylmenaquinone methyltransferase/2-methoxy-6-polyprenyl-1,4-benzoquinol methylase
MNADNLIHEMISYYSARAPSHDEYMNWTGEAAMEELLAPVIAWVEPLVLGRDVLEIACGTGNWTRALARRARSVVATDFIEPALHIARQKCFDLDNVTLLKADAFKLDDLEGSFGAAFAADWWSHIPKSMLPVFLEGLHSRLKSGANVVFIDMLYRDHFAREPAWFDDDCNRISRRTLPDGREFDVVKNFPTEDELRTVLTDYSRDVVYREHEELKRWMVSFSLG